METVYHQWVITCYTMEKEIIITNQDSFYEELEQTLDQFLDMYIVYCILRLT